VAFVAAEPGPKPTDDGALALVADHALHAVPNPDVVVAPGGDGNVDARADERVLDWLRTAHETSRWTTSVCTGSLILGAAGLLQGQTGDHPLVRAGDAAPVRCRARRRERVVFEGKVVTAAGVSSGIDMALTLAARIAGDDVAQAIQLAIEYDPQPPYDSGHTSKARPAIVEKLRKRYARA
jgi:transcriptional regulator GlxA family with amidase domain